MDGTYVAGPMYDKYKEAWSMMRLSVSYALLKCTSDFRKELMIPSTNAKFQFRLFDMYADWLKVSGANNLQYAPGNKDEKYQIIV